jgi:hypothetical protein
MQKIARRSTPHQRKSESVRGHMQETDQLELNIGWGGAGRDIFSSTFAVRMPGSWIAYPKVEIMIPSRTFVLGERQATTTQISNST